MTDRLPGQVGDDVLELRLWQPDEVGLMHEAVIVNLEHLRPWMPWAALEPLTIAQRLEMIAEWRHRWEGGGDAPMGMWHRGAVVGGTGYVRRTPDSPLEIGYWVHVDHPGKGYATRATRLLTSAAFEAGVVSAIEVHHDKANLRSARVPARLGFEFVGERPDEASAPGEVGIDCAWRMTSVAWDESGRGEGSTTPRA